MMHGGNSPPTYLISDKEALCSVKFLTVPAYGFSSSRLLMGDKMSSQARKQVVRGLVRPGDVLRVSLDFTAARQLSTMVRVRLLQKETHTDGTRLQVGSGMIRLEIFYFSIFTHTTKRNLVYVVRKRFLMNMFG